MIRRLFRALFGCAHDWYRERDKRDVLHLVCDKCDKRVPVVFGQPKKIKKLQAQMAKPKTPATVTPIRRAK